MLNKDQIIQLIKEHRFPCWTITSKKAEFSKESEQDFKGSFVSDDKENEEAQIEKAISRLETLLGFLGHEKCHSFVIKMKPTAKSSGQNVLTYEFRINENQSGTTPASQINGLNGPASGMFSDINHMQSLGYIPFGMIEVERERNKVSLEGLEQRIILKTREDRLIEREKELAEKLKEADSGSERLSKAATKFVNGYLDDWIKEDKPTLKGSEVSTIKKEISDSEDTPARLVIANIAETLDNNFKNEKDLVKLKGIIDSVIEKIKNSDQKKDEENKENNEQKPTE